MTPLTGTSRFLALVVLAALLLVGAWRVSAAGTICGTVRDANTMQPVQGAAVFLFNDSDQYTGIYAGTDIDGKYCLEDVPPGTYTIQVQRDDYETVIVEDVVVEDDATGIDVVAHPRVVLRPPVPNPARDRVTFGYAAPSGAAITIEIYDVKGRLVRGWRGTSSGAGQLAWDLTDTNGNRIASGIYLVRLSAGDVHVSRRLVHFR